MSEGQVLDYSAGFPGAAKIKNAGYVGAVRYIGFPSRHKCTTAGEFADFTANKIGMALVYEDTLVDWRGGRAAGRNAGQRARNHATAIGFPTDRPIYMAIDQDVVNSGEFNTMIEYLLGAGDAFGRSNLVGVYGEADVIDRARDVSVAKYFWQTAAWSHGRHTAADLYQHVGTVFVGGVACDENDVNSLDWGQHNFKKGGWLMSLTDQQQQQLWQWVSDLNSVFGSYYELRKNNVGDQDNHTIGTAVYDIEAVLGDAWVATKGAESGQGVSIGKQVAHLYNHPSQLTDAQISALGKQISDSIIAAGVSSGGVSIDQVVDAVRTVFADAAESNPGQV